MDDRDEVYADAVRGDEDPERLVPDDLGGSFDLDGTTLSVSRGLARLVTMAFERIDDMARTTPVPVEFVRMSSFGAIDVPKERVARHGVDVHADKAVFFAEVKGDVRGSVDATFTRAEIEALVTAPALTPAPAPAPGA